VLVQTATINLTRVPLKAQNAKKTKKASKGLPTKTGLQFKRTQKQKKLQRISRMTRKKGKTINFVLNCATNFFMFAQRILRGRIEFV
jgi:ribosomal protein L21E